MSPRPFDYESNALTKLSYPGAQLLEQNDFLKHNIFYSKHFSFDIASFVIKPDTGHSKIGLLQKNVVSSRNLLI